VPDEPTEWNWSAPGDAAGSESGPGSSQPGPGSSQPGPASSQSGPLGSQPTGPGGPERLDTTTGSTDRILPPRRAATDNDFGRTIAFTIAGTAVPGLGLIAARRRLVGGVILGIFLTGLLIIGSWAAVDLEGLLSVAVRPAVLNTLAIVLLVTALLWVGVIVATHLALRRKPTRPQRAIGAVLVGVLAFAVAAPMAVAARYSYDQASLVSTVFKSDKDTKSATRPDLDAEPTARGEAPDPWKDKPRVNILLLGGDAGPDRSGTRTDTVILASIDTQTGDTTLFSLPRNTGRMPFPSGSPLHKYYPYGFTSGDGNDPEYFLNAMYDSVPHTVPKDVLGETDNLGADALKLSVGSALGLEVDYYVLINLQGFSKMVNALGGITVNINTYIPIGGNTDLHIPPKEYLKPGPDQHLNGRSALWYARGRYGSDDYARMDRQRCVINAIIKQANPTNVLARYEQIAKASKDIVLTDLPQEVLPLMVDLSLRAKDGNVRSIVFKHGADGFISPDPDYSLMRQRVKTALAESTSSDDSGSSEQPNGSASPSSKAKKKKKTQSEDVNSTCAYQPDVAATARPPR
jgi:LCP family protein required for cell wall assembly